MLNKGIAIQTILLLVVGIIVAGIIIYLVFRTTTSSTLSSQACMGKMISWCTTCKLKGAGAWDANCHRDRVDRCRCFFGTTLWDEWASKCVDNPGDGFSANWNFDPSATVLDYQTDADGFCPRVGVS